MFDTKSFDKLVAFNTQEAIQVLMEPAVTYPNLLANKLKLYNFAFGRDKVTMSHMQAPSNIIQAKAGCDNWKPKGRINLRPNQIATIDHEIMMEYCFEDFNDGCLRNLLPAKDEIKRLSSPLSEFQMAINLLVREGLINDFFKLAWFSNQDFADEVASDRYDPSAELLDMMTSNNGWWAEIQAYVNGGQIRFLDTNDGTISGNATNKNNVTDYLRELKNRSTVLLKGWKRDGLITERPMFLVQSAIFDALLQHYEDLDIAESMMLQMNGEDVPGVLKFNGHLVKDMSEWEAFDIEAGAENPDTGYSKNQRALFIAPQVLSGLINAKNLAGQPYSFMVQQSPDMRDKGKTSIYGQYGYGFGLAHNDLVSAGYNSSFTFA